MTSRAAVTIFSSANGTSVASRRQGLAPAGWRDETPRSQIAVADARAPPLASPHAIPLAPRARSAPPALQALPRRRRPRQRRDRHRELPQHRVDAGPDGARLARKRIAERTP